MFLEHQELDIKTYQTLEVIKFNHRSTTMIQLYDPTDLRGNSEMLLKTEKREIIEFETCIHHQEISPFLDNYTASSVVWFNLLFN